MKHKRYKLITYLVITLAVLVYIFFEAPNLNPFFYSDGAFFWAVVITLYAGAWALMHFGEVTFQFTDRTERPFNYVSNEKFPKWTKLLLAAPWVFFIVCLIVGSFIFNANAYRDQLGESRTVTEFSSDMQAADLNQIPIVDQELAVRLADKKLGEKPGLGSQVRLGANDATIQRVDGKLVWAVPLYHSGLFKWLGNLEGSRGYILVSATDVNDVQYVDCRIKYQPGNYLLQDLKRHTRFGGAWFDGITDPSFEVDDEGNPNWVYSTYRNLRGFSLPEATGAWIVNATTGEMHKYTISEIPEWVDRVQPEGFVISQINNKGEYVHGWLNFSDRDKFRSSPGHMIIYNNDHCYLFTGMTSVGGDNSAIGFIMVDMVTKESIVYSMPGATEEAAQGSAEGKVQHLGYDATFPLILNIEGQPTYFMALKDQSRLIKQYAFVSVANYSIVGAGETIPLALRDYQQGIKNSGIAQTAPPASAQTEVTGTVARIASEVSGGDTLYKMILTEHPDQIFIVPALLSDELALTREGDHVKIEYAEGEGIISQALSFDNLAFTQE